MELTITFALVSFAVLMICLGYLARLAWASHRAGSQCMATVARSGAPGVGRLPA